MNRSEFSANGVTATDSAGVSPARPMDVIWYEEKDLTLDLRAERSGSLSRIARELITAPTHESRTQILRATLAMIGFSQLSYATLQPVDEQIFRVFCMKNYENSEQVNIYFQERFFEIDIRDPMQRHQFPPIAWDLNYLGRFGKGTRQITRLSRFLNHLRAADIQSGLTFGLSIPRTNLHTVISLTSPNPRSIWINDSTLGQGVALGMAAHELFSGHVRVISGQARLTDSWDIQRQIVSCLATGMSNPEIASRLGKPVSHVHNHLLLLQKKYDVESRSQLAYVTGRLRLA